ncbi:hypothetical protein OC846_001513 [Tilletia horrida]|uniref:BHLH domain-containing protein n=1 Tax=Tilletia horrida TaxID=155126 RepID=A0AAN6GVW6_9BASI|nr:hypothetical protein OC845_001473 [Tilletia horrida]KAK0555961.1 hypothetical protein OC846_001513 [Tilletia horrida]KAK0568849.1 hypothetical protein OC861_001542 [Tilletia horrida]
MATAPTTSLPQSSLRVHTHPLHVQASTTARPTGRSFEQSSIWTLVDRSHVNKDVILPPLRGIQLLVDAASAASSVPLHPLADSAARADSLPRPSARVSPSSATLPAIRVEVERPPLRRHHRRAAAPPPGTLGERCQSPTPVSRHGSRHLSAASLVTNGVSERSPKELETISQDEDEYDEVEDDEDEDDDDDDEDEFVPPPPPSGTVRVKNDRKPAPHELIEDSHGASSDSKKRTGSRDAIAGTSSTSPKKKCPCRPRSRKTSHSVIERRRRQKINERLIHLQCSVPACREEAELLLRSRHGKGGASQSQTRGGPRSKSRGKDVAEQGSDQFEHLIRDKLTTGLVVEKLCVISHAVDYLAELEMRLTTFREAFARAGLEEPAFQLPPGGVACSSHNHEDELDDDEEDGGPQPDPESEPTCKHGKTLAPRTKRKRQDSSSSSSSATSESGSVPSASAPQLESGQGESGSVRAQDVQASGSAKKRRRHWGRGDGPLVDDLP